MTRKVICIEGFPLDTCKYMSLCAHRYYINETNATVNGWMEMRAIGLRGSPMRKSGAQVPLQTIFMAASARRPVSLDAKLETKATFDPPRGHLPSPLLPCAPLLTVDEDEIRRIELHLQLEMPIIHCAQCVLYLISIFICSLGFPPLIDTRRAQSSRTRAGEKLPLAPR